VFEQWKLYWRMQRWGEEWQQTAQLTAAELKTQKPIAEFMPKYEPPEKETDPKAKIDKSVALLNQLASMHAGAKRGRG